MDKAQAQVLAQIFDELGNSYNKVTGLLKAYCEANNIDVAEIAPQIAQNVAAVGKGKKQKKLPRYETVWSAEELKKLEEGLKEHKFDVAKVQAHVGTRKAGEVKKYMTQYVKAGVVKGIELPAELAEEEEDSSEDEKSVAAAPAKTASKKGAAAPVVTKKAAAAPASAKKGAAAKKQESSEESSSEEEEEPKETKSKKLPGKRPAPESDDESSEEEKPKKKEAKKPEPKKSKKESSSSSSDSGSE